MKINILNTKIDKITMNDALKKVNSFFDGTPHIVYTPNPEIIMEAQKNKELMNAINNADLVLPDSIGVVIASKIVKNSLSERVPGFDFCCNLMKTDKSFYFFGSKEENVQIAVEKMKKKGVNVVGYHNGYFTDDNEIILDINNKKPDVVLVCLGAPKQELWIDKNKDKLNTSVLIGAGGTIDVLSDKVKRAPIIYQKLYIEWLYRALKQPSRLPRLIALPHFILKVITSKKQTEVQ